MKYQHQSSYQMLSEKHGVKPFRDKPKIKEQVRTSQQAETLVDAIGPSVVQQSLSSTTGEQEKSQLHPRRKLSAITIT